MAGSKTQKELEYSRPLDRHKDSSSPEVNKLVMRIESDIRKHADYKGEVAPTRRNLMLLLLNLYVNWQDDPELYTGISFDKSKYKAKSRYNSLAISARIIPITEGLVSIGYLERHRGFYKKENPEVSRRTRIRPKAKLKRLFKGIDNTGGLLITRPDEEEIIELRTYDPQTKKKPQIEYSDSEVPEYVTTMRNNLRRINADLVLAFIGLDKENPETLEALQRAKEQNRYPSLTRKKLYRIFNNESWEQGGRFYRAWWTEASKDLRRHIVIGDKEEKLPVVEIDYSAIQIDLLYAMQGIDFHKEFKQDPYTIPGHEKDKFLRSFCKLALLVILNADDKAAAHKALQEKLIKRPKLKDRVKELGGIPQVIELFENRHDSIKSHFYSGIGRYLQYLDSQIAEKVMLYALEEGFVVLPVHDSFLCGSKYSPNMYRHMIRAYQEQVHEMDKLKPFETEPFPRVTIVESKQAIILKDLIRTREMISIETEQYEAFMAELAEDAGDGYDSEDEYEYEYDDDFEDEY